MEGLGDLIDGYEFHYPQELNEDNLDDVREALAGHDFYCMATGLHLDPRFGRGGLTSPDGDTRAEADQPHPSSSRKPRPRTVRISGGSPSLRRRYET